MAMHWAVRVLEIGAGRIALEVRTLHGDAGRPDDTATFALGLVLEQWYRVVSRYDVRRDFAENLADANARAEGPPWDRRLPTLYAAAFGEELEVSPEEFQLASRAGRFRDRAVLSGGLRSRRARLWVEGDWARYQALAERAVRDLRIVDAVNDDAYDAWPNDESKRPRVTLRFEVDPPELLSFLHEGMSWESTVHR